jgi:hypothetical protein
MAAKASAIGSNPRRPRADPPQRARIASAGPTARSRPIATLVSRGVAPVRQERSQIPVILRARLTTCRRARAGLHRQSRKNAGLGPKTRGFGPKIAGKRPKTRDRVNSKRALPISPRQNALYRACVSATSAPVAFSRSPNFPRRVGRQHWRPEWHRSQPHVLPVLMAMEDLNSSNGGDTIYGRSSR